MHNIFVENMVGHRENPNKDDLNGQTYVRNATVHFNS